MTDDPLAALDGVGRAAPGEPAAPDEAADGPADGLLGGGWFGRLAFDGPSRLAYHDHLVRWVSGRWRFEALPTAARRAALADRLAAWRAALASPAAPPGSLDWRVGEFDGPPPARHLAAVERAVELIRAGELYQVNVCTRLAAPFEGSPAGLFAAAVESLAPRYAAFLAAAPGLPAVVSLSPELFLRRRGRLVRSEPIKGTLPAGVAGNEQALRRSAKDAAENVMIVDLVRNDLGRVCATGSVRPASLLEVQRHPGVWHLVSAVEGRLRPGAGDGDLLRASFPPGSVTGAPKLRALAAIAELEPAARGTYTGAIGFASPLWGSEFSVAIRTFEAADGRVELGVGGGITADSVPMLEWRECLDKATPLVTAAGAGLAAGLRPPVPGAELAAGGLLETILAVDGAPLRLADHLARLDRSSRELYGAGLPAGLAARVLAAAREVPIGRAALRVTCRPGPDGPRLDVSAAPAPALPEGSRLALRRRPAGLWRHKWADRSWAADGLYRAADGTVLETARGNVFLIGADGALVTPPLRDDLLPGVTRRALLDLARDLGVRTELRGFTLDELRARPAFWTSSLSGVVAIHEVEGVALPRADELMASWAARLSGGGAAVR